MHAHCLLRNKINRVLNITQELNTGLRVCIRNKLVFTPPMAESPLRLVFSSSALVDGARGDVGAFESVIVVAKF